MVEELYSIYIKPFEHDWEVFPTTVEASNLQSPSIAKPLGASSGMCSICKQRNETLVCFSCQQRYRASWDDLPLCIVCGLDIDPSEFPSCYHCECCAGCAHISCVGECVSTWICRFCSQKGRKLSIYYSIDDKKSRILTPIYIE